MLMYKMWDWNQGINPRIKNWEKSHRMLLLSVNNNILVGRPLPESGVPAKRVSPVSQFSLLQLRLFYVHYVHPWHTAYICISDQCDRRPLVVYHDESRSDLLVYQQLQSLCVSSLGWDHYELWSEFHSKRPDTPDRTWQPFVFSRCRRHTPHLQVQHNSEQLEQPGVP